MPANDPATEKQREYLWNLIQGGFAMGLHQHMRQDVQTEQAATTLFQSYMTREQCSTLIEDLIFRVGAVPPRSGIDEHGNPKQASEAQIKMYRNVAQELATAGQPEWMQYEMAGRNSWTVSKWISRLLDIKEYLLKQSQPGESVTGGTVQQPAPPSTTFQPSPPPAYVPPAYGGDEGGQFS